MKSKTETTTVAAMKPSIEEVMESVKLLATQVVLLTAKVEEQAFVALSDNDKADVVIEAASGSSGVVYASSSAHAALVRKWAGEAKALNAKQSAERGRVKAPWHFVINGNTTSFLRLHGRDKLMIVVQCNDDKSRINVSATQFVEPKVEAKSDLPF